MNAAAPATAAAAPPPEYIIEGVADPWADRRRIFNLLRYLTRRHLAERYRGSSWGVVWSLLNPLLMMGVYTFVFRYILRASVPGVAYPVFFLSGYLAWNGFNIAAQNAAASVVDGAWLIRRACFPRVVLPLSAVLSNVLNFLIALPLLVLFNWAMGTPPGWRLLWAPLGVMALVGVAVGIGLLLASLAPFFRDLLQLTDIVFQAWFFATPILYPVAMVEAHLGGAALGLYRLNPMLGPVRLMQTALLDRPLTAAEIWPSLAVGALLLAAGWWTFRRAQHSFSSVA